MEPRQRGAGYPKQRSPVIFVLLAATGDWGGATERGGSEKPLGGAMAVINFNRSIPELLADVVNNFTVLVRKETQLARVEMSEKIGELAVGIGLLIGGSVLLIPALVILLQSAVAG